MGAYDTVKAALIAWGDAQVAGGILRQSFGTSGAMWSVTETWLRKMLTELGTLIDSAAGGGVPTSRKVDTSNGLTGGGDLSADRTLSPTYGSTANTVCQGNDSRLSDPRSPTAHQSSHVTGTDQIASVSSGSRGLVPAGDGNAAHFLDGTGSWATPSGSGVPTSRKVDTGTGLLGGGDLTTDRTLTPDFGSGSGKVCQGNDSRLSDDRTASGLRTATTVVAISSAAAPAAGQALIASAGNAAAWQLQTEPYFYSNYGLQTPASGSGDYSLGGAFSCLISGSKITGARFVTKNTANPHTVRVKLLTAHWNGSAWVTDSVAASVDVVCAGAGTYVGTFASAYAVADAELNTQGFVIMMWHTGDSPGPTYTYTAVSTPSVNDEHRCIGRSYQSWGRSNWYYAGEVDGSSRALTKTASYLYPIDPIIQAPY